MYPTKMDSFPPIFLQLKIKIWSWSYKNSDSKYTENQADEMIF